MESKSNNIIIYTDGGSRGNPGSAAYGFVVWEKEKIIYGEGSPIGIATNNVAEYEAVLKSFEWVLNNSEKLGIKSRGFSGITARMDSLLACQQLKKIYKIKSPRLAEYVRIIRILEVKVNTRVIYEHVFREKNKDADALVNLALDANSTVYF